MNKLFFLLLVLPFTLLSQNSRNHTGFIRISFIDKDTKQPVQDVADTILISISGNQDRFLYCISGPKGRCNYRNVIRGNNITYAYRAHKSGYTSLSGHLFFPDNDSIFLELQMGKNNNYNSQNDESSQAKKAPSNRFSDETPGGFSGLVDDKETGAPLDSVRVYIFWYVNKIEHHITTYTNRSGHFECKSLQPFIDGQEEYYNIVFYKSTYREMQSFQQKVYPDSMEYIHTAMSPSGPGSGERPGLLKISFSDRQNGKPLAGVSAMLTTTQGSYDISDNVIKKTSLSDTKGNCILKNVPVDKYASHNKLIAAKNGYVKVVTSCSFYFSDTVSLHIEMVSNKDFDTTLCCLAGEVVDGETGKPVDSASVILYRTFNYEEHTLKTTTDASGYYIFPNLQAFYNGYSISNDIEINHPYYGSSSINHNGAESNTVEYNHTIFRNRLKTPQKPDVSRNDGLFKVLFTDKETGKPLENVSDTLTLTVRKGMFHNNTISKNGGITGRDGINTYENLRVSPYTYYSLHATKPGYVDLNCYSSFYVSDSAIMNIQMEHWRNLDDDKQGFYGDVVDLKTGKPLDSAAIHLLKGTKSTGDFQTATTDSNGHFAFPNIPTKFLYTITIDRPGYCETTMTNGNIFSNRIIFFHVIMHRCTEEEEKEK